jgi:hypothetical protein
MNKTFFSRITIFLIAITILFFVSGIGAKEIDANIWKIDGYDINASTSKKRNANLAFFETEA